MILSETSTETIPSKNPENPKNNPETQYTNDKNFNNDDLLYIVEKVLKSSFFNIVD